ncbi:MAG: dephospho-CoA kinase [Bacteroidaceae bacterium]|nr:dephospho-CoA kinase [Bacteroidaceae bacterium]
MTPIKLGITGGIGSGKSVVAKVLCSMGIPVFDCDAEAKRLSAVDPVIRQQLIDLVGRDVYQGGVLNKPMLANYLFDSASHVQQVNGIIHPVLKDYFRQWVDAQSVPIVAMESAIIFEAGFDDAVDCIVMVVAPLEVRIERAMLRDGVSRNAIEQRVRHQIDDAEKCRKSHYAITNDGKTPVIPQVLQLINTLSQK